MINISIIGASGSIGTQAKEIVRRYPDRYRIRALTVNTSVDTLKKDIEEFSPDFVGVSNLESYNKVAKELDKVKGLSHMGGERAANEAASLAYIDIVLISVVGMCGLSAVLSAVENKKTVALANKEALVAGGELVMSRARELDVSILPVDSEHSAIFQCLHSGRSSDLKRIILTASGGPFRNYSLEEMEKVTVFDALKHPTWSMGKKITIDSATLMNKGLEVIEARWLFGTDRIECVIHPQSIIHSFVEWADNSVLAQMSYPSMEIPISLALSYPDRIPTVLPPLDFNTLRELTFEPIDRNRFRCLYLAEEALKRGGFFPSILNSANERAVELFLKGRVGFLDIPRIVEDSLNASYPSLELNENNIYEMDRAIKNSINY